MGSRGHDIWQLTLARPKPTRSAFSGSQNAAAVDVIAVRNLPTSALSLVSLALACARSVGKSWCRASSAVPRLPSALVWASRLDELIYHRTTSRPRRNAGGFCRGARAPGPT